MNTKILEALAKAEDAINRATSLQEQLSMLSTENWQLLGEIETLKIRVNILETK